MHQSPSSNERKLVVEPESEDIKTKVRMFIGTWGKMGESGNISGGLLDGAESLRRC